MMSPVEVLAPTPERAAVEPLPVRRLGRAPAAASTPSWGLERIQALFGGAALRGQEGTAVAFKGVDPFVLRRFRFGG